MRQTNRRRGSLASSVTTRAPVFALAAILACALGMPAVGPSVAAHQAESDLEYSPATDPAHVIAQGVVALPEGEVVWRTVRTRAALPADATFEERPLGFVLASTGPLLLIDQGSGEQTRLGIGEAVLVRAGAVQQRSSLGQQPVSYLSIELVPSDAPPPPADATVLQPGQPFAAPSGLRDLDLLSATLAGNESFTIPDSGAKNVALVTNGAAGVGRPGGDPVVLLAGEAASFSGDLQVSTAPDGGNGAVSFVVAMIGPEVPRPEGPAAAPATPATESAAPASPAAVTGEGTITIQVFTCPPGMDAQTIAAAACAPASGDVAVSLSGDALASPLTLADAEPGANAFTWSGLPFGDYLLAETTLPAGSTTYTLAAANASGDPESGYRVTIDEETPALAVRIYNLAP